VLRGVWVDERNIADRGDLAAMLKALGLPERRLDDAASAAVNARYEANTQRAIELQVFGAPSYVIDGELFWGQDRLDFVERRLAATRSVTLAALPRADTKKPVQGTGFSLG
jgi:carboxymethylenebutenolidase